MPLNIDNQVTVTSIGGTSLTITPVSNLALGVIAVQGPIGPSGASIVGPPGPVGTGSASAVSGYATGLFSGPLGSPITLRATTGELVEVLGNGSSGNAPSVNNLNVPIVQPIYGTTGALLGQPDGWWSFLVSGRSVRTPYYYA